MGKKKLTPAEAEKGQPTVESYYTVVEKPSENKNKEKPLNTDKEIALSAGNNESNDNDSTTTTIRTDKGTIMGSNTAPTDDDGKDLELDKTRGCVRAILVSAERRCTPTCTDPAPQLIGQKGQLTYGPKANIVEGIQTGHEASLSWIMTR